jgi:hypothetical protein
MAIEFLGIDLAGARAWNFYGTGGVLQKAKLADVRMAVLKQEDGSHAFEVSTTCAFCDTFAFPVSGGLLGQEGFFSKFKVNFLQPYKYFEIDLWPAALVHPIQSR